MIRTYFNMLVDETITAAPGKMKQFAPGSPTECRRQRAATRLL